MTSFKVGVAEGGPSRDIDSFQDHLSETPVNPWCCIVYHCVHTTHTHLCMAYNESTESTESTETPAVIYMFDFFSQNMITWYGSTSGPENYFLFGNSVYIERVVHLQDTDTNTHTHTHTYIHCDIYSVQLRIRVQYIETITNIAYLIKVLQEPFMHLLLSPPYATNTPSRLFGLGMGMTFTNIFLRVGFVWLVSQNKKKHTSGDYQWTHRTKRRKGEKLLFEELRSLFFSSIFSFFPKGLLLFPRQMPYAFLSPRLPHHWNRTVPTHTVQRVVWGSYLSQPSKKDIIRRRVPVFHIPISHIPYPHPQSLRLFLCVA